MEISNEVKDRVIGCLGDEKIRLKETWVDFAKILQKRHKIKFDKAVFPQIMSPYKHKRNYNVVKDLTWFVLARYYNVLESEKWKTANTTTFLTVYTQLEACQDFGLWQMLCDRSGIGKSYAAKQYERDQTNVFYIDCSEFTTRNQIIRALARHFGMDRTTNLLDLWAETTDKLLMSSNPLIIWDEFGDCAENVITLVKGLYNKANMGDHMALGCYFIGADNLEKRLIDGRIHKKPSYAEFWSRFNNSIVRLGYSKMIAKFEKELEHDARAIIEANITDDIREHENKFVNNSLMTGAVRCIQKDFWIAKKMNNKLKSLKNE